MAAARKQTQQDGLKETIESLIVAFALALIFRAFVIEPFVIPTGSMAPTLLGRHIPVTDDQTGFSFPVDVAGGNTTSSELAQEINIRVPMSHELARLETGTRIRPGDRILVQKYLYTFSSPQRWDVVVFKNPTFPEQNFIKRLVGLPNESLLVVDGNVFVQPRGRDTWQIARKPQNARGEKIHRATFQPIYHSSIAPIDRPDWTPPWQPTDGDWQLTSDQPRPTPYHLRSNTGTLRFDFVKALRGGPGLYPYSQAQLGQLFNQPIEDIRLAARIVADQPGLAATFTTTSRLNNPDASPNELQAHIDDQGQATLRVTDPDTAITTTVAGPIDVGPFKPGRAKSVELWYVDQRATLWVDGRRTLVADFDLPLAVAIERDPPALRPDRIEITLDGAPATLHDVQLDRDLFYMSRRLGVSRQAPTGCLMKLGDQRLGSPLKIEDQQFFCMGDNSPVSEDGRLWGSPAPWVNAQFFADDPTADGLVPGELMVGKAFFVYWPAPFALSKTGPALLPNFANMRFIH